jgi:hypothetical protein
MVHTNPEFENFEFDQHLGSHKHMINIIMWFRDMGCYSWSLTAGPKWHRSVLTVIGQFWRGFLFFQSELPTNAGIKRNSGKILRDLRKM